MSTMSFTIRAAAFAALAMATVACQARERRAITTQPTPVDQTKPGGGAGGPGGQPTIPVNTQPPGSTVPGSQPPSGTLPGAEPGTVPGTVPGQPGTVPPPSDPGTLPPIVTDTSLVITTTLDDGTTVTMEWDGKSFKGNDKWDVQGQ